MITLALMTEEEYRLYLSVIIPDYAAENVQSGRWTEAESLERSTQAFATLLPQGIHTPRNFVGKLLNEQGQRVGNLWYQVLEKRPETAFIYDFEIGASFRRLGYGVQALAVLEAHVRLLGVKRLELHVFGFNIAARELYKKAGFRETDVAMARDIQS